MSFTSTVPKEIVEVDMLGDWFSRSLILPYFTLYGYPDHKMYISIQLVSC